MSVTPLYIYGIPTCSTCKRAQRWLDDHGVTYTFMDTRQSPPTIEEIRGWVQTLGSKAMRNTSGQAYRALDASRSQWDDDRWIEEFSREPMLLKRPLFVRNNQALMAGFRGDDETIARSLSLSI